MGGDFAPLETTLGAIHALREVPSDVKLVLIGDKEAIVSILKNEGVAPDSFEIVHTTEVIEMADQATKAIQQKPKSSISVGFHLLKEGKIDAFASAGNTGAMLVGSMFSVKAGPGILLLSISSFFSK